MNIFTIAGLGIVAAVTAVLLKKEGSSLAICVSICTGCILLLMALEPLSKIFGELEALTNGAGIETEWLTLLLKALGLCYITQFSGDCCRDAGETALAGRVELAGKIAVLGLSMPLFQSIVSAVIKFI